jgi:uncharacterized protein (DUF934 family)
MPVLIDQQGQVLAQTDPVDTDNHAPGVVNVATDTDMDTLETLVVSARVVSLEFLSATDGRGLTIARLLRGRLGFTGCIRAVGDVAIDLVPLLKRCGVDQFVVPGDAAPVCARLLSTDMPTYQAAATGPATVGFPGFRKLQATPR